MTCGLELAVRGREIVRVRGDRDDVFSHGFLCPKGTALADLHHDPDRLRKPMRREGHTWIEMEWEAAYDYVGKRLGEIRERHGADAIAVYQGNPTVHNLGLVTFGRLLAGVEPYRARWALQHLPYGVARRIRPLIQAGGEAQGVAERQILRIAWECLIDEGQIRSPGGLTR